MNRQVDDFLDKYFQDRPQLKRPDQYPITGEYQIGGSLRGALLNLVAENAHLTALVEQNRRDAERYRFLRDPENWDDNLMPESWDFMAECAPAEFDEMVDGQMLAATPPPTQQEGEGYGQYTKND